MTRAPSYSLSERDRLYAGLPLALAPGFTVALVSPHYVECGHAAPGEDRAFTVRAYELRIGRSADLAEWTRRGRRPGYRAWRARLARTTGAHVPAWMIRAGYEVARLARSAEDAGAIVSHVRQHARKASPPPWMPPAAPVEVAPAPPPATCVYCDLPIAPWEGETDRCWECRAECRSARREEEEWQARSAEVSAWTK